MHSVMQIGLPRLPRNVKLKLAAVAAAIVMVLALCVRAAAAPYMGVDTWYAYGPSINEQTVVNLANSVVARGLRDAGYRYVWLDAGWWNGARDAEGNIVLDPALWPDGMSWLVGYIHSLGLRAGIYTDAGPVGCANGGSFGHYQQDADQFAAWGFDAIKVDYCGGLRTPYTPAQNYAAFRRALDATGRPMLLNVCDADDANGVGMWLSNWTFGPLVADSWRTGPDIGYPGNVRFADVLRNLDLNALHPKAQREGHYNDPDYIAPGMTKTVGESAAQVSMWAMQAAPFMVSADIARLSARLLSLVENRGVIAIDQDPLSAQARQVAPGVWIKPLANGDRAVAFLDRSPVRARMTASVREIGLGRRLLVRAVWRQRQLPINGAVSAIVPPDSVVLLRVSPRPVARARHAHVE